MTSTGSRCRNCGILVLGGRKVPGLFDIVKRSGKYDRAAVFVVAIKWLSMSEICTVTLAPHVMLDFAVVPLRCLGALEVS